MGPDANKPDVPSSERPGPHQGEPAPGSPGPAVPNPPTLPAPRPGGAEPACPNCGFSLAGAEPVGKCPECGEGYDAQSRLRLTPWPGAAGTVAGTVSPLVVCGVLALLGIVVIRSSDSGESGILGVLCVAFVVPPIFLVGIIFVLFRLRRLLNAHVPRRARRKGGLAGLAPPGNAIIWSILAISGLCVLATIVAFGTCLRV